MFKKVYLFLTVCLAFTMLAACSAQPSQVNQNSSSNNQGLPQTNGRSTTTVTVMTWEDNETNAAIDDALKSFMAANPDLNVERIPSPNSGYGDKLNAMVQSKSLPDIFWAGNDTEQLYGQQGLLYDWTSAAKAEKGDAFRMNQFAPGSIENWTSPDGKLYGLPTLMNTYGFWYNEDLFKAANLPLPKPGWTYDEMFADAKALTQKDGGKITRFGIYGPPMDPFMTSICSVSAGGQPFMDKVINPTKITVDQQYINCTNRWAQAVKDGSVTPPGYPTDGIADQFIAGQVPMFWNGQWFAPAIMQGGPSFKYGFAPMPIVKEDVQPYDAVGIASPAYIKNPAAVWRVMKFLASDAWKTVLPKAPVAPSAHMPSSQPYYDALKADGLSSVADSVKYELEAKDKQGIRFTAPWSSKANDILTSYWNDILQGQKSVDDVSKMATDLNSVITR